MIEIRNLSKSFEDKLVLDNVSQTFVKGKTHVLLGQSGCGKSTLLKMILGILEADQGTVHVNDILVSQKTQNAVAKEIGYVVQEGGLFPHWTAQENVLITAKVQQWPREKMMTRLHHLASLTGLDEKLLARYPKQLSGGQRQRVGLMRALMLDPPLLILDEPLGALDPLIRSNLQSQLKDLFQNLKKTVLMVTHDIGEAVLFGDSITVMNEGRFIQTGSIKELLSAPADSFVSEFIRAQKQPAELYRA